MYRLLGRGSLSNVPPVEVAAARRPCESSAYRAHRAGRSGLCAGKKVGARKFGDRVVVCESMLARETQRAASREQSMRASLHHTARNQHGIAHALRSRRPRRSRRSCPLITLASISASPSRLSTDPVPALNTGSSSRRATASHTTSSALPPLSTRARAMLGRCSQTRQRSRHPRFDATHPRRRAGRAPSSPARLGARLLHRPIISPNSSSDRPCSRANFVVPRGAICCSPYCRRCYSSLPPSPSPITSSSRRRPRRSSWPRASARAATLTSPSAIARSWPSNGVVLELRESERCGRERGAAHRRKLRCRRGVRARRHRVRGQRTAPGLARQRLL